MPDVSIIVPVHNRVELLRQTLISCAIQTYEDCEVLVVDDDSEQDVSAVIDWVRCVFGGPCLLRYIRQPRRGVRLPEPASTPGSGDDACARLACAAHACPLPADNSRA